MALQLVSELSPSSDVTPVTELDDTSDLSELFRRKKIEKKPEHIHLDLENEYSSKPEMRVKILQPVIYEEEKDGAHYKSDRSNAIQKEMDYLSVTAGLEVGTARSDILQDYVDQMVLGDKNWEGKLRVVIMNRRVEPSAFAFPDGSIFISQSLINLYDTIDEVVSILAHEVKHVTNGTARAAYKAQIRDGESMGVDWLHEMTSDFGSPELLEKVKLKSTATSEMLSKLAVYFGNRRGTEHQAPIMRAVEQLALHAVKDFDTSHIPYTDLPAELRRTANMTNYETIVDALMKDDVVAVESYLKKLHVKDFGRFFQLVDQDRFYNLETIPDPKAAELIQKKVGAVLVERLVEEGFSEDQIKIFFLSVTENYGKLAPQFSNLDDLAKYIPEAEKMYEEETIQEVSRRLLGKTIDFDPVHKITNVISYSFERLTDPEVKDIIRIESLAGYVKEIMGVLKDHMPMVRDDIYVDENGDSLSADAKYGVQRSGVLLDGVYNLIFRFIKEYYVANSPEGELDQAQIEEIFESMKDAGYTVVRRELYFPLNEDAIGPQNQKIIEKAFKKVFGIDLIKKYESESLPLPTSQELKEKIKGMLISDIETLLQRYARENEFDIETRVQYVQACLDEINERDFIKSPLEAAIEKKIGPVEFGTWKRYGDPTWNPITASLKNSFLGATGSKEKLEPKKMSLDELMNHFNLDAVALRAEAAKSAELTKLKTEIGFVARMLSVDESVMFEFVERMMENFTVDPKRLSQIELMNICQPLFELVLIDNTSDREKITDFERFMKLPLVDEIVSKIQPIHLDTIQDLEEFITKAKSESRYKAGANFKLFEDDVYSVLLAKPIRDELLRLTLPGQLRKQDYPALIKIIDENFPYSPQVRELKKNLQNTYLLDPEIEIQKKITYFFDQYKVLGIAGAITVAEQINDVATYKAFKEKLDALALDFVAGRESLENLARADIASSVLTQKADVLLKTASDSKEVASEVSTDLAKSWIEMYMASNDMRRDRISYDIETKKFVLTDESRSRFASLSDTIDYFKNLSDDKKLSISMKAMSDQDGLLVSEDGRILLEKMLADSLGIQDQFMRMAMSSAIRKGDAKVVGLPAAQMLKPYLFRAMKTNAIDYKRLNNSHFGWASAETRKIGETEYAADLPKIFSSTTAELRFFGAKYQSQPNSDLAKRAQESGQTYFNTLESLTNQFSNENEETENGEVKSKLPVATEAMIKAGESSPVFVRGMQMAVQLIQFEKNVQERLSQTQDSMQGMEKLRFWENLVSKADGDAELASFLENDLVTLDSYLGGGSLFTTYGATVWVDKAAGTTKKVVIKMLNPNAEEFIRLSYGFSSTVLSDVEQNSRGKTRQDARLAGSLLDLSNTWCIRDINDTTYSERDDLFRLTIDSYNKKTGKDSVMAPDRGYTSKKVKVEDQCAGTTLNKFLSNKTVSDEQKEEVVTNLLNFFQHQFDFAPQETAEGKKQYIFHSDPHAGNYMIDSEDSSRPLGAIDRSMYLALDEPDVKMFKLLKDGQGSTFLSEFISRCLEVNGVKGFDASLIKYKVLNQLGGEAVRQTVSGKVDTSAYLQIIMQQFTSYGEKYSLKSSEVGVSTVEKQVLAFLKENPESEVLDMFDSLKNKLINGENGTRNLSYIEFRQVLSDMQKKEFIKRKAIDIPLEFRLMIRNIVAMQNLEKNWVK